MRFKSLYFVGVLFLFSCSQRTIQETRSRYDGYYAEIQKEIFEHQVTEKQILFSDDKYTVNRATLNPNSKVELRNQIILEKKFNNKSTQYFIFSELTQFKEGKLCVYGPPVKEGLEYSNNGIWFHADFYSEGKYHRAEIKYNVVPANYLEIEKQMDDMGLYHVKNGEVSKVCETQSLSCFHGMRADGLYYLPPPGRFYKEFTLSEIK